jgi:hypothetical protein
LPPLIANTVNDNARCRPRSERSTSTVLAGVDDGALVHVAVIGFLRPGKGGVKHTPENVKLLPALSTNQVRLYLLILFRRVFRWVADLKFAFHRRRKHPVLIGVND